MFWITYSVNIDRQAVRCVQRHCWHCVFIRCVGGCSLYLTLQLLDYLLLHGDWGECSEGWAWGWRFLLTGKKIKFLKIFFPYNVFFKNVPGVLNRTHKICCCWGGFWGCLGRPTPPPGGRAGSENDTLLPMNMTRDRPKFWNGPAWRSKVIIRKPWRRKNNKKIKNSDKTIRHSRLGMPNIWNIQYHKTIWNSHKTKLRHLFSVSWYMGSDTVYGDLD